MRNLGLDLLRLIAVLLVLGRHLEYQPDLNVFLSTWRTGGWVGVDIFFVLSGFLVSGLLFKEHIQQGKIDIKRFLVRRAFKLYPAFYALIAITVLVRLATGAPIPWRGLVGELFFIQNYIGGLWYHTWSLAVEEHFYLGISLLIFWLLKLRKPGKADPFRSIPVIFILIAIACLAFRASNLRLPEFSYQRFVFETHIRIDALMFGVLLSYWWHYRGLSTRLRDWHALIFVPAGCFLMVPAFLFPMEFHKEITVFATVPIYVGAGLLVLASTRLAGSRHRSLITAGILGASSYSIYLWHMAVAIWGWPLFGKATGLQNYAAYFVFYMGGSLAFGLLMSRLVEWPMLRIRERFFPNPRRIVSSFAASGP